MRGLQTFAAGESVRPLALSHSTTKDMNPFPILLPAGQDNPLVIDDLKHMPGKVFDSPLATACFNLGSGERYRSQAPGVQNGDCVPGDVGRHHPSRECHGLCFELSHLSA